MSVALLGQIAERLQIVRPLVVVDVETTGKVAGVDRIVQIAIMKAYPASNDPSEITGVKEWSTFVDPQMVIPAEATLAHKITNEMIAGAPTWSDVAWKIYSGLVDVDFVGQNVRFDLRFLEAEFARVGIKWSYADAGVIDTLRIDQVRDPRDLTALLKKYCGEDHTDAHDAMADVSGTVKVLAGEFNAYPDLPSSVAELHALLFPRDPSWVDAVGKIVWRNQDACIGFGKWNGHALREVVTKDRRYLQTFILEKGDFPEDVKEIVRAALDGTFPIRAAVEATV
jgi:DNA polymerase-3 subunit epsilon